MNISTTKIILCGVLEGDIRTLLSPEIEVEILDSNYHHNPKELHTALQKAIDSSRKELDTIILGFGLCSLSLIGLKANRWKLIIPRVDDCISLFLGSGDAYRKQSIQEPGTYYMTKGWIEAGITPFNEYDLLVEKYGLDRADFMMDLLFKDFKRLVFIRGDNDSTGDYCIYTKRLAKKFGLRFEEIPGSNNFFKKLIFGPWDDDFVIINPGSEVMYADFKSRTTF